MNKTIYSCRLVKDIDLHYSTGEKATAMTTFAIAVQRNFKNSEGKYDADFFRCKAFGNKAEFLSKYFHKGDFMILEGHWQNDNYKNKEGVMVYQNSFFVDAIEFGGSSSNKSNNPTNNEPVDMDFMNIPDGAPEEEQLPW